MKATIKDVARVARVSPSTVSRALQNNPRISQEVRTRVQRVAKELDFHPNQMARSLVRRHSHIVGVMFPGGTSISMGHPFYPEVLRGIGQVASQQRYHMLLSTGSESLSDVEAVRDLVGSGYVSGLLLLAAQDSPMEEPLSAQAMPVVEIGHPLDAQHRCFVDNDNVMAGWRTTEYLLERGHKRILFLGYDARFFVTVDRRKGYEQALAQAGIALEPEWVVSSRFMENTTDNSLLEKLFQGEDRPTAVVSMDDTLSIGLIGFLRGRHLHVPEDVSLVSFNNTQAGQYCMPALTSVDVDPCRLGVCAMQLLLDMIDGKVESPTHVEVPFRLVERHSVSVLHK